MGKPGIPQYGDDFALETNLPYSRFFDPRLYRFKADYRWHIQSGKGAKSWMVFFAGNPVSEPVRTMKEAMDMLKEGAYRGLYQIDTNHGILTKKERQDFNLRSKLPANTGGRMTVPEAEARIEAIIQSRAAGKMLADDIRRLREILDSVWLQAYEEGLQGVFES